MLLLPLSVFSQNDIGDYYDANEKLSFREYIYYIIDNMVYDFQNNSEQFNILSDKLERIEDYGIGAFDYEYFGNRRPSLSETDETYKKFHKNNLNKYRIYNNLSSSIKNKNSKQTITHLKELRHNILIEILLYQVLHDDLVFLIENNENKIVIRKYLEDPSSADFILIDNKTNDSLFPVHEFERYYKYNNLFSETHFIIKNNSISEIRYNKPSLVSKKKTGTSTYSQLSPIGISYGEMQFTMQDRTYDRYTYLYHYKEFGNIVFENDIITLIERKINGWDYSINFDINGIPLSYVSDSRVFNFTNGLLYGKQEKDLDDFVYTGQTIVYERDFININEPFISKKFYLTNYSFENILDRTRGIPVLDKNKTKHLTEYIACNEVGLLKVYYEKNQGNHEEVYNYIRDPFSRNYQKNKKYNKGVNIHNESLKKDLKNPVLWFSALEGLDYGMSFPNFLNSIKLAKTHLGYPPFFFPEELGLLGEISSSEWKGDAYKIDCIEFIGIDTNRLIFTKNKYTDSANTTFVLHEYNNDLLSSKLYKCQYSIWGDWNEVSEIENQQLKNKIINDFINSNNVSDEILKSRSIEKQKVEYAKDLVLEDIGITLKSDSNIIYPQLHKERVIEIVKKMNEIEEKIGGWIASPLVFNTNVIYYQVKSTNNYDKYMIKSKEIYSETVFFDEFPFQEYIKEEREESNKDNYRDYKEYETAKKKAISVSTFNSKEYDKKSWPDLDLSIFDYTDYTFYITDSNPTLSYLLDSANIYLYNTIIFDSSSVKLSSDIPGYSTPIAIPITKESSFIAYYPYLFYTQFYRMENLVENHDVIFVNISSYLETLLKIHTDSYKEELISCESKIRDNEKLTETEQLIFNNIKEISNAIVVYKDRFLIKTIPIL